MALQTTDLPMLVVGIMLSGSLLLLCILGWPHQKRMLPFLLLFSFLFAGLALRPDLRASLSEISVEHPALGTLTFEAQIQPLFVYEDESFVVASSRPMPFVDDVPSDAGSLFHELSLPGYSFVPANGQMAHFNETPGWIVQRVEESAVLAGHIDIYEWYPNREFSRGEKIGQLPFVINITSKWYRWLILVSGIIGTLGFLTKSFFELRGRTSRDRVAD